MIRSRIPVVSGFSRTVAMACLALVVIALVCGQHLSAQQSATDLMIQSRSQEQPQPSARRIALPPGNPLEVLPVQGSVYMIAGAPSNIAVQIGAEGVLLVHLGAARGVQLVARAPGGLPAVVGRDAGRSPGAWPCRPPSEGNVQSREFY